MKRLLLVLSILSVLADVSAQQVYNVTVRNDEGKPLKGVLVYSTINKRKGELVYKELKEQQFLEKKEGLIEGEGKTDDRGYCEIKCFSEGAIILDGGDVVSGTYNLQMHYVSQYRENDLDFDLDFVLSGKENTNEKRQLKRTLTDASQLGEYSLGGQTEALNEVTKRATPLMKGPGEGIAERHGRNKIRITKELEIKGEHARSSARFVAFPYIVFEETKDSVHYMPPTVVDGKDYGKSMERRMGFDSSRDKLDEFRYDHAMQMQDHCGERFLYSEWANITKGTKYYIPGILWYEDYNAVYQRDSLIFSDGKEREPMRFLNWSDARSMIDIDRSKFYIPGRNETVSQNDSYNMEFEQGSSKLNMKDSATVAERNRMLQNLIARDAVGELNKIVIRGYSSPEGLEKRNRELSHSRAQTIKDLLASNLRIDNIVTEFNEYDNIVPWQEVADSMSLMDDSLAHNYSVKLREIIADKDGFDAQYRAIRANRELYNYLDKHVLKRVRVVEIEVGIVVRRVLEREEIVKLYEENNNNFRERMLPYQYYAMLCYLADQERWDDLYDVSKRAYGMIRDMGQDEQRQYVDVQDVAKGDTLQYMDVRVPYPLAGYYYALASLRKGIEDVKILRPYLDDGSVGENRGGVMNSLPFIVAQVLMYCQGEDFDEANNLVKKYRLMSYPQLKGLIMFVRCLDGQYRGKENEDVRQYVMSTSEMNKAVMYTALGQYREALEILYGDEVPQEDAKIEYMKAICHFRLLNSNMTGLEVDGFTGSAMYVDPENDMDDEDRSVINTSAWGAPMLNALRLDKDNIKYLENDGYFNDAYRQMVMYFWKRQQMGVPIEKIVMEYNALVAQMRKNKAQQKQN